MSTTNPFATPDAKLQEARIRRDTMNQIIYQIRKYAKEAHVRGWTGPEQVYLLTIHRLREDIIP